MQTQRDYSGDVETIPGVLRGYRQFKIIDSDHHLIKMNYIKNPPDERLMVVSPFRPFLWSTGWNEATCTFVSTAEVVQGTGCTKCDESLLSRTTDVATHTEIDDVSSTIEDDVVPVTVTCACHISSPGDVVGYPNAYYSLDRVSYRRAKIKLRRKHDADLVPQHQCQCGFYATYTMGDLIYAPGITWNPLASLWSTGREMLLVGVVEAAGRITLGKVGFRAHKMRLVGVSMVAAGRSPFHSQDLSVLFTSLKQQGVKVFSSIKNMCLALPPNDLTEILPTAEKAPDGLTDYKRWSSWANINLMR